MNGIIKIRIVEIGPGTGALAESVIEYLKMNAMRRKINFEYHCVEISKSLCSTIEQRFDRNEPRMLQSEQIKVFNQSIFDYNLSTRDPTFVIGMEILDNMPHDRLYKETEDVSQPWTHQTMIDIEKQGEEEILVETYEEINDEW